MTDKPAINKEHIAALKQECEGLLSLCSMLNNSPAFRNRANIQQQAATVKAEHIITQDFINLYHRLVKADAANNSPRSKFTLVYYYECLKRREVIKAEDIDKIKPGISAEPLNGIVIQPRMENALTIQISEDSHSVKFDLLDKLTLEFNTQENNEYDYNFERSLTDVELKIKATVPRDHHRYIAQPLLFDGFTNRSGIRQACSHRRVPGIR